MSSASICPEGYARATGRTGVVLATSGPGATNLVTGIATAYMDSVPMVAFTGNVTTEGLGKDGFQEAYIEGEELERSAEGGIDVCLPFAGFRVVVFINKTGGDAAQQCLMRMPPILFLPRALLFCSQKL